MGPTDPGRLAAPAAGTTPGINPGTAPAGAHVGDGGVTAPRCLGEAAEGAFNWEAAWIDLGGEG
jgi:hypothetical protein